MNERELEERKQRLSLIACTHAFAASYQRQIPERFAREETAFSQLPTNVSGRFQMTRVQAPPSIERAYNLEGIFDNPELPTWFMGAYIETPGQTMFWTCKRPDIQSLRRVQERTYTAQNGFVVHAREVMVPAPFVLYVAEKSTSGIIGEYDSKQLPLRHLNQKLIVPLNLLETYAMVRNAAANTTSANIGKLTITLT